MGGTSESGVARGNSGRAKWAAVAAVTAILAATCGASSAQAAALPFVSAGSFHTCGVTLNGSVSCWGANGSGQATVPADLGTATQVTASDYHSCAVKTNGTVSCWGANGSGQISVPSDLGTATQVSAGQYHTCAVKTNGTVSCWGANASGQATVPSDLGTATQVTAGNYHSCAVKTSGALSCWGASVSGQANPPSDLGTVTQASAGGFHSCAVKTNGTVSCWGANASGQTTVPSDLGTATEVATGEYHTCALRTNGTVSCWGAGVYGQTTPPSDLGRVIQISAGQYYTCAVKVNRTIRCWGAGAYGQTTAPPDAFPSLSGALIDFGNSDGLDFGDVTAGRRSPVLNSVVTAKPALPGIPLALGAASVSNTGEGAFQLVPQSCTAGQVLDEGVSCMLRVRFTPRIWQSGDVNGSIAVTDDSATGTHTILLTGTAVPPESFIVQNTTATPAADSVGFAWETSDASKVALTIAQPVTTRIRVRQGRKIVTKTVTSIKQLPIASNLASPAGPGAFSWNRMVGKAAAAKGTWSWVMTINATGGRVNGKQIRTGTVTLS